MAKLSARNCMEIDRTSTERLILVLREKKTAKKTVYEFLRKVKPTGSYSIRYTTEEPLDKAKDLFISWANRLRAVETALKREREEAKCS